jgi:hypothetical protein
LATPRLVVNTVSLWVPGAIAQVTLEAVGDRAVRGDDRPLGGAAGRREYDDVVDSVTWTVPYHLMGDNKISDGTANSDQVQGLDDNWDYLVANLGLGTRVIVVYHQSSGATKTTSAKPRLTKGAKRTPTEQLIRLDLVVASGGWS